MPPFDWSSQGSYNNLVGQTLPAMGQPMDYTQVPYASGGTPIRQFIFPSQPSTSPAQASNFEEFNQMLQPYQAIAERFSSPYATFSPNSQFTQQHPSLASAVDRGLLSAALTPSSSEPQGVGQGISNALRGVVGANDFYRQRAMQSAMLPYQMLQPKLQAMDTLSQMQEREAMVPYYQSRANFYEGQLANNTARTGIMQQRANTADQVALANEGYKLWQQSKGSVAGSGLTPGHIVQMQMSSDPDIAAAGQKAAGLYSNLQNSLVTGRVTNTGNAEQPFKDRKAFQDEQLKQAYDFLPKRETIDQFTTRMKAQGPQFEINSLQDPNYAQREFGKVDQQWLGNKQRIDNLYNKWRQDKNAQANQTPFADWMPSSPSPARSTSAPSGNVSSAASSPVGGKPLPF